MALVRYEIDGRQRLSKSEVAILKQALNSAAFIPVDMPDGCGLFDGYFEENVQISQVSPLLAKCSITDITQHRK